MQKLSIRKLSLLGLVLLAASAVTAAVMPKDKSDKEVAPGNTLTASTGCQNQVTCVVTNNINDDFCDVTASTTSSGTQNTSDVGANGARTAGAAGDTTFDDVAAPNTSASPC